MPSNQELHTREFVATHLMTHANVGVGPGCLICVSWKWARELGDATPEQVSDALKSTKQTVRVLESEDEQCI